MKATRLQELLREAEQHLATEFDNREAVLPRTLRLMIDIVREHARERSTAVSLLLSQDNHQWSTRPCKTCQAATALIGADFGCVLKAKEAKSDNGRT